MPPQHKISVVHTRWETLRWFILRKFGSLTRENKFGISAVHSFETDATSVSELNKIRRSELDLVQLLDCNLILITRELHSPGAVYLDDRTAMLSHSPQTPSKQPRR